MACRMMASSDVMGITKWSIQARRPRKAPPSVNGPKTISNLLAEERPFLSARIGIAMIGPGGFPAAGGSSFDEGQRPSHGPWCNHQYHRDCEHQTQQTEYEHTLAHVGAPSTKANVEAGRSDELTRPAQPPPTS